MSVNPYQTPREEGFARPPRLEDPGAAIVAILLVMGVVALLMFAPILILIRVLGS